MSATAVAQKSTSFRAAVAAAIGFVGGLFVGALATATVIGWALFTAADTGTSQSVPFLIDVEVVNGTLRAHSSDGLFLPLLAAAVLGALIGLTISLFRRSR